MSEEAQDDVGALEQRMSRALMKLCAVGLGFSAVNILMSVLLQQPGARFQADMIVAVGIVASFFVGLVLSLRGMLQFPARLVSAGMMASLFVGDLWLGQITDKLWYMVIAVVMAAFGLQIRALWVSCLSALLGLVGLWAILPGHPLGTSLNPMQLVDVAVLCTGVSYFVATSIRASLEAQRLATRRLEELEVQRELAEQSAVRAEVASDSKSMFLANVSHELRTPLNAIIGYSELMLEEAQELNIDHFDDDLERVRAAAKHLKRLIDDVLDLSKVEAGKMELSLEAVVLGSFLREVSRSVEPLAKQGENALVLDVGEVEAVVLTTDRTRLRQILLNLLSNACKFTERGQVRLVGRKVEGGVTLSIEDSGRGMTPEELARAFEVFVTASASTSRRHKGTGLGLPLTRRMCALLGGSVDATSVLGQGSSFTVMLPLVAPSPVIEAPSRADEAPSKVGLS